jgi:hypothetical protein
LNRAGHGAGQVLADRERREAARAASEAIERALIRPAANEQQAVLDLLPRQAATRLADRVRLLATRLAKTNAVQRRRILAAADALILALYRRAAPNRWWCGWCDASVGREGAQQRAGVGAVIHDEAGREIESICLPVAARAAFDAEIAALEATLAAAAARGEGRARSFRVYSDCAALVSLWHEHRRDPRLRVVRELTRKLRRFELRQLPRRHNQPAHRLARAAASGTRAR